MATLIGDFGWRRLRLLGFVLAEFPGGGGGGLRMLAKITVSIGISKKLPIGPNSLHFKWLFGWALHFEKTTLPV